MSFQAVGRLRQADSTCCSENNFNWTISLVQSQSAIELRFSEPTPPTRVPFSPPCNTFSHAVAAAKNRVTRSQAGQSLTCECGETLQVPTLRGLSQLAVAADETIAASSVDRKSWGGWRGSILAAGCAVFVIFLLPCAYYIYVRSQLDTSYTVADEIAAGEANYDAMDMPMLFTDWVNFERNALGRRTSRRFTTSNCSRKRT